MKLRRGAAGENRDFIKTPSAESKNIKANAK